MKSTCVAMLALACALSSGAPCTGEPPAPASMRTMRTSVVVDATPQQVWDAFTTKEGVESWMVPLAEVDFRMGGTLKTNYNKQSGIGGPGTIIHHILAYDPYTMITMRFEAPDTAADKKLAESCWWMVYLDEVGPGKTRVTESMAGWGEGPEWDKVYGFFEKGNQWTLQQLVKKFAKPEGAPPARPSLMTLLDRFVGGDWVHENVRDGKTFRARNSYTHGPDGVSLIGSGWLGDADGMHHHGSVQIWTDPGTGAVRFQNIDEHGALAWGEITQEGDNTAVWDWVITAPGGKKTHYRVKTTLEGPDKYRFLLFHRPAGAEEKQLVEVLYSRVTQVPEAFLKVKPRNAPAGAPAR